MGFMMKPVKWGSAFIVLTVLILIIVFYKRASESDIPKSITGRSYLEETATHEGRENYEFLRLRDPKTGKIPSGIAGAQLRFTRSIPAVESFNKRNFERNGGSLSPGWKNRGPYNVGGRTRALGIDIRNENIIVAGGASGGIWKSTDNGKSWQKKTKSGQMQCVTCLVQDTRQGRLVLGFRGNPRYLLN